MSFLNEIKSFFTLIKESNFNLEQIYMQNPNGVYILLAIILVFIFIIFFLIKRSIKVNNTVKLVSKIQDSKDINEYSKNLTKLVSELPKTGIKVANSINIQKNDILEQELNLLKDLDIKEKIYKYQEIASQYSLMKENTKKYKMEELTAFYGEKSKSLLDENLQYEIEEYCKNADFNESDVPLVNSIVKYSNTRFNKEEIINLLKEQIDRNSYGYNTQLYKFIKALTKDDSLELYEHCNGKLNSLLEDENTKISEKVILNMIEDGSKQKVYNYIINLTDEVHLQTLYDNLFAKTSDIDLDLAFVANEVKINDEYKKHLDNKLTENWKDISYIKYIIEAPRVIETIGHIDYRNVLERIEKLQTQDENNKMISQALEMARNAQELANEAKAIARAK